MHFFPGAKRPPNILTLLVLLYTLTGCTNGLYYRNITQYKHITTYSTESGIQVGDKLGLLDLVKLDRLTNEVEECVGRVIRRNRFKVKVPEDVYISPCTGVWLFPCDIDPQLCRDKGVEPTEECPCNCRGAIQDDSLILITPDLVTYKLELVRLIMRVGNPYRDEELRKCL